MVWKGRGDPSRNFWGPVQSFLGVWDPVRCGERCVFHPSAVHVGSGRFVGPYPLWDSVSGSPVHWGFWSILTPNIFGSGAAWCGVSLDHQNHLAYDAALNCLTSAYKYNKNNYYILKL